MFYYIISAFTLAIGVLCFVTKIVRSKKKNLVYFKSFFWLFEIIALLFSVLLGFFTYKNETDNLFPFVLACIIGFIGLIYWLNEIIIFDDNGFTSRNVLRIKKHYKYKDVNKIKIANQKYGKYRIDVAMMYIFVDDKKISIMQKSHNCYNFIEKLETEYAKAHNGKKLRRK